MGFSSTFYSEEYGTTCKLIGAAVIPKRWDSDFAFAFAFVFVVDFDFDFASFSAWNIVHTGDDRIHFFFFLHFVCFYPVSRDFGSLRSCVSSSRDTAITNMAYILT